MFLERAYLLLKWSIDIKLLLRWNLVDYTALLWSLFSPVFHNPSGLGRWGHGDRLGLCAVPELVHTGRPLAWTIPSTLHHHQEERDDTGKEEGRQTDVVHSPRLLRMLGLLLAWLSLVVRSIPGSSTDFVAHSWVVMGKMFQLLLQKLFKDTPASCGLSWLLKFFNEGRPF